MTRRFEMSLHGATPADDQGNKETPRQADEKLTKDQKTAMQIALLQAKKRKTESFKNRV